MKPYQHTQIGYVLIVALGAATLMIVRLLFVTNFNLGAILVLAVMALCLLAFATLTVQVTERDIHLRFGIGFLQRHFALKDIQSYRAVRNPWYYAWGIHAIPGGWIFNVSGWEAVELQMKNGSRYRIGTNDVQSLMEAIGSYAQKV